MFLPVALTGILYATEHPGRDSRERAATPAVYMNRLSPLWSDAVFTADPTAIPGSAIMRTQLGPVKGDPPGVPVSLAGRPLGTGIISASGIVDSDGLLSADTNDETGC
jgi:hypothetical protein